MFICKACDPNLMPSYPQHRNLKRKSEEPVPRPVAKSETDDRYNNLKVTYLKVIINQIYVYFCQMSAKVVHSIDLMAIMYSIKKINLIDLNCFQLFNAIICKLFFKIYLKINILLFQINRVIITSKFVEKMQFYNM